MDRGPRLEQGAFGLVSRPSQIIQSKMKPAPRRFETGGPGWTENYSMFSGPRDMQQTFVPQRSNEGDGLADVVGYMSLILLPTPPRPVGLGRALQEGSKNVDFLLVDQVFAVIFHKSVYDIPCMRTRPEVPEAFRNTGNVLKWLMQRNNFLCLFSRSNAYGSFRSCILCINGNLYERNRTNWIKSVLR